MDAPHGQETAQDARDLPPLPREHPRRAARRVRPEVITGEPGAGKLACRVSGRGCRKRARRYLAGCLLHSMGGGWKRIVRAPAIYAPDGEPPELARQPDAGTAPAAYPTSSIKRPRNARAVTLPGGRGGRSGRLQAAARRQERRGFGAAQFETAVRSRTVVVGQELLDHCLQVAGAEDPSVHHPLRDDHKPPRGLQGGVDQVADARRALSTDSSGRPELNLPRTSQAGSLRR
jgi:hypothetical protein